MAYVKKVTIAGKVKEVYYYHSYRYQKKGVPRSPNKSESVEAVKKVNERSAETKLRNLMNANFGYKDIHLVLTYKEKSRPQPELARKHLEKFIRDLRNCYKKLGRELKYISVTEYLQKAIHHHIVFNKITGFDLEKLMDLWTYGQPRPTFLYKTGEYSRLASYLIKETSKTFNSENSIYGKRWNASRNLTQPTIHKSIIHSRGWRMNPKSSKDWILDESSVENGVHEFTGFEYQFFSMIRRE